MPTMTERSKQLREKRNELVQEMHDLTKDGGAWAVAQAGSPAEKEAKERHAALDAQQQALATQIDAVERTEALQDEMRKVVAPPAGEPGSMNPPETRVNPSQDVETRFKEFCDKKLGGEAYRHAFKQYLRRGEQRMASDDVRILHDVDAEARTYAGLSTSTSGDAAGYQVPIGFQKELEIAMKAYGRMRDNCRIINTATGNTLDWPTMDDTSASAEEVAEAQPVSQLNPTFSQVQFSAFLESSKQVLVSVQLMQDAAFDQERLLQDAFAARIGRRLNYVYTNGTGTAQAQGLVYAIKNASVPNVVDAIGANSNSGISGDTEANSIGSDDFDNLIAAVDPAYRPQAKFMMHWKTIDAVRKVKDKYGRPLWASSLAVGEPDRIWGYPFDWNADMDQIGANKYTVLFGDFSKHLIRDVGGLTVVRYSELYMPNHQLGFQAFLRTDSRLLQLKAFSLLRNPLS